MKLTTLFAALLLSTAALADDNTIDDLQTIGLNAETSSAIVTINYPGYRLGGGTPPRRDITDCLMVDIQSSDEEVTLAKKLELAKRLTVEDGYRLNENDPQTKLVPVVKGTNVVFNLVSKSTYVTHIKVSSKDKKSLQANLDAVLKSGGVPAGLVYVRACRF